MATDQSREVARRFTEEVWRGQLDALDGLLDGEFTDHDPQPGQRPGPEGYKQMAADFFRAFPDLRASNQDVIAEGDKLVVRWNAEATHTGELMGIAPTGKQVRLRGIEILRIRDGRIVERWGEFDAMGMMQQLGVIPSQ
ncbi:MAG: ester cyclase [Gemmatimonadota bacterium]|nr:ester cyclase [Gemmatimonadota bacterium]